MKHDGDNRQRLSRELIIMSMRQPKDELLNDYEEAFERAFRVEADIAAGLIRDGVQAVRFGGAEKVDILVDIPSPNGDETETVGIEVKEYNKVFTNDPETYPFPTVMVETPHVLDEKPYRVLAQVIISRVTGHILVIPVDKARRKGKLMVETFVDNRSRYTYCRGRREKYVVSRDMLRPFSDLSSFLLQQQNKRLDLFPGLDPDSEHYGRRVWLHYVGPDEEGNRHKRVSRREVRRREQKRRSDLRRIKLRQRRLLRRHRMEQRRRGRR